MSQDCEWFIGELRRSDFTREGKSMYKGNKGWCIMFASLGILILLSGCAVVMPTIRATYPPDTDTEDIVAAAVLVLQEYNFTVAVVSPKLGLVVTDWRAATTPEQEVISAVASALVYSPYHPSYGDPHRQRIKLSLTVDKTAGKLIIKPVKQGSSKVTGWSEINLDDGDKGMLRNLALGIVARIGGSARDIEWEDPMQHAKVDKPKVVRANSRSDVIVLAVVGSLALTAVIIIVASD